MAKPNKRQSKREQRTKCELGCSTTFGRKSDRRRHMKEQHGPPIYCSYPGCPFTARRVGKLRNHLSRVHHREITTNLILPSEFRTATAPTQTSANHSSILEGNINFNFALTAPPTYTGYAFTPQVRPEVAEPHAVLNNEFSPFSDDSLTFHSSVASRKGDQSAPYRIYRPCRVRRRPPYPTTRTSSASPSQAHLGSAKGSTPDFSSSGQGSTSLFAQWMQCALNFEPISEFLDS